MKNTSGAKRASAPLPLFQAIEGGNQVPKPQLKIEIAPPMPKLLKVDRASDWMKMVRKTPSPKMLFGNFWMQGELCILFADTNAGKSILAVQLADSISRQQPISDFELELKACPVLYIDFELSTKQFEQRYTGTDGKAYRFHKNFYRAEVDLQVQMPKDSRSFADIMSSQIEDAVKQTRCQVLFIDNITCLGGSADQTGAAMHIMRTLKQLKTRYGLSIMVLAHTPKQTQRRPITRNDLGGSKMLMNFADSAVAIGTGASNATMRYLKQVKQRAAAEKYGTLNVCVFKLTKTNGFLHFAAKGNDVERKHLHTRQDMGREALITQVLKMKNQRYTQREIADHLCLSPATVNRMIQQGAERAFGTNLPHDRPTDAIITVPDKRQTIDWYAEGKKYRDEFYKEHPDAKRLPWDKD